MFNWQFLFAGLEGERVMRAGRGRRAAASAPHRAPPSLIYHHTGARAYFGA